MQLSARVLAADGLGGRIVKVNHAGENGAVNIYAGQLLFARFTAPSLVEELREFRSHEMAHREIFRAELERRGVRRCRSYLLCGLGGYVLGLITGAFGRGAIAGRCHFTALPDRPDSSADQASQRFRGVPVALAMRHEPLALATWGGDR